MTEFPELMRKGAESGFDINGLRNGIMLRSEDHVGGHPSYNADMIEAIEAIEGIDLDRSPAEIAQLLTELMELYREAIENNTYGPWY